MIIINADPAIIQVVLEKYLLLFHLLYLWYLNKNIMVKYKKLFKDEKS